jgi:hypothetical protein
MSEQIVDEIVKNRLVLGFLNFSRLDILFSALIFVLIFYAYSFAENQMFPCKQCSYSTNQISLLRLHTETHNDSSHFQCDISEQCHVGPLHPRNHQLTAHENGNFPSPLLSNWYNSENF